MARKLTEVEKAERLLAKTIAFCKRNNIKPGRNAYSDGNRYCAAGAIAKMQGSPYPWLINVGPPISSIIDGNDEGSVATLSDSDEKAIGMALGRAFQHALR